MRVPREGMEDQDTVALVGVWSPPRFVGDRDLRQETAALERKASVDLVGQLNELPPTRIKTR
jgi:hypothetical protein